MSRTKRRFKVKAVTIIHTLSSALSCAKKLFPLPLFFQGAHEEPEHTPQCRLQVCCYNNVWLCVNSTCQTDEDSEMQVPMVDLRHLKCVRNICIPVLHASLVNL